MATYNVIVKQTHYYLHEIDAEDGNKAVQTYLNGTLENEGKNIDESFGDWQEMLAGEIIGVERKNNGHA